MNERERHAHLAYAQPKHLYLITNQCYFNEAVAILRLRVRQMSMTYR